MGPRPTLTGFIDCSIIEHDEFQRMSSVEARTLQVESNTFNLLGAQENLEKVEYLKKWCSKITSPIKCKYIK